MQDEHEAPERYIAQARKLLQELRRPSPYAVIGVTPTTPTSEIHKAFIEALRRKPDMKADVSRAQKQLKDPQERLLFDNQRIDAEVWLRDLEQLRQYYARFDFLHDIRDI